MRARLILVLSLLTMTAFSAAAEPPSDAPERDAALTLAERSGLFGAFHQDGATLAGTFVSAIVDPENGTLLELRLRGEPMLAGIGTGMRNGTLHVDGPSATLEADEAALTIHNNRYGWITYHGGPAPAHLELPAGSSARASAGEVHIDRPDGNLLLRPTAGTEVTLTDHEIMLTAKDTVGFTLFRQDEAGAPAAWALVARADGAMVADVLHPDAIEVLEAADDRVRLHMNDLESQDAVKSPSILRLEAVGVFMGEDAARYVAHQGPAHYRQLSQDRMLAGAAQPAFNVSVSGDLVRFLAHTPPDAARHLTFEHDTTPPRVQDVRFENLTEVWDPANRVPLLITTSSEPALGRVLIPRGGGATYEKPTVQYAIEQRFRLGGLEPNTTYAYHVILTDLAGNRHEHAGNLTTPPAPQAARPAVEILAPGENDTLPPHAVVARFHLAGADGAPLPERAYTIFLDKTPLTQELERAGDEVRLELGDLAPGPHELVVEARDPTGGKTVVRRAFAVEAVAAAPAAGVPMILLLGAGSVLAFRSGRLR